MSDTWANIDIYIAWVGMGTFLLFFAYRVIQGMESGDD